MGVDYRYEKHFGIRLNSCEELIEEFEHLEEYIHMTNPMCDDTGTFGIVIDTCEMYDATFEEEKKPQEDVKQQILNIEDIDKVFEYLGKTIDDCRYYSGIIIW